MFRTCAVALMACGLFVSSARADVPRTAAEQRALAEAGSKSFSLRYYPHFLWAPSAFIVDSDWSMSHRTISLTTMPCVGGLPERPVRVIASPVFQDAHIAPPRPKHMNVVTLVFTYRGNYFPGSDSHVLLLLSASGKTIGYFRFTSLVHARGPRRR